MEYVISCLVYKWPWHKSSCFSANCCVIQMFNHFWWPVYNCIIMKCNYMNTLFLPRVDRGHHLLVQLLTSGSGWRHYGYTLYVFFLKHSQQTSSWFLLSPCYRQQFHMIAFNYHMTLDHLDFLMFIIHSFWLPISQTNNVTWLQNAHLTFVTICWRV